MKRKGKKRKKEKAPEIPLAERITVSIFTFKDLLFVFHSQKVSESPLTF